MIKPSGLALLGKLIAGAVIAGGAALIPLAQYTSALFLWKDSPISVQAIPDESGPVPARLVWSPGIYRLLTAIAGMPGPATLVAYLCFAAAGAYVLLRILNPTFRVTTGVDWDRWILFKTYMHTAPLIKVIVTIVPVMVAVFFLWWAVDSILPAGLAVSAVTAVLVGAASWLALSRNGFVGDCESGNYLLPCRRESLSLLARGGAFGLIVWCLFYALLEIEPEALLRVARALGGVGEASWRPFAGAWLVAAGVAGGIAVLAGVGFGQPEASSRKRWLLGASSAVLSVLLVILTHVGVPAFCGSRFDYDWKQRNHRYPVWWTTKGQGKSETRVWLAAPVRGEWIVKPVAEVGVSEITLHDKNMQRIREHLSRRRFSSALAVPGFVALYDHACLRGDIEGRFSAAREGLWHTGDPLFLRTLLADLWELTGTPEARKHARVLGERHLITYLTDDAHLPAGDICARNDLRKEALGWYAKAGVPRTRARERLARMTLFTGGVVHGTVKTSQAGFQVQALVIPTSAEVLALMGGDQPREVPPFALRAAIRSTSPAAEGRFQLDHLAEGEYVVGFLASVARDRGRPRVSGGDATVRPFGITASSPDVDLGTISIGVR